MAYYSSKASYIFFQDVSGARLWNGYRIYASGDKVLDWTDATHPKFYSWVSGATAGNVPHTDASHTYWTPITWAPTALFPQSWELDGQAEVAEVTNVGSNGARDFEVVVESTTFSLVFSWENTLPAITAGTPYALVFAFGSSGQSLFLPRAYFNEPKFIISAIDREVIAVNITGQGSSALSGPATFVMT